MPKISQTTSGRKRMWETPQITADQTATGTPGGRAPSKEDVVKAANARGGKRHEMKHQSIADVGVLPDSDTMVNDERVGIHNHDYLVKKNLEFGVNVNYNSLPPGMDIEDQENSDIRKMRLVNYQGGLGYPGDGWDTGASGTTQGSNLDRGRPSKTNDMGGKAT